MRNDGGALLEIELQIDKLVAGGDGLGFVEGKAVFAAGVLPGERVRARLLQRRRDFDRAETLEILEPSPRRVSPACPLAGRCGGCDWLHIAIDEQREQKRRIVAESLRRVAHLDVDEPPIEGGEPLGCRTRAQIHRGPDDRLGYMEPGSDRVVAVESCPIAAKPINGLFDGTVAAPAGLDRFTVLACGDRAAREGIDDGQDLSLDVAGRAVALSVGCFFQSNLGMLGPLVRHVRAGAGGAAADAAPAEPRVIADLYCGVGLFGAFLREGGARVVAVEQSPLSLSYARRNIGGQGGGFFPMSVEQWIQSGAARERLDVAVVDPPRVGLGPEVREWLRTAGPARLVYVSCNPVTLARDLGALVGGGYELSDLRLFDFYPQTSHVESVACLSRPRTVGL